MLDPIVTMPLILPATPSPLTPLSEAPVQRAAGTKASDRAVSIGIRSANQNITAAIDGNRVSREQHAVGDIDSPAMVAE